MLQRRPKNKIPLTSYHPKPVLSIDSVRSTDGNSPLGTNTVLAVTGCENEPEASPDEKRRAAQKLRYDLQETAQKLLKNEPEGKRLLACMVVRVDRLPEGLPDEIPASVVVVERSAESERARYANLVHCDSPWTCPICSQRRTEEDKREVNAAYLAARARGWIAIMVTYTQRHNHASALKSLLEINAEARRGFKSGNRIDGTTWSDLKAKFGLQGGIINLEVTHGENAWHPHNHELIFIDPEQAQSADMADLRIELAQRWKHAVQKQGGDCDLIHGLDLRTGDDAISEYIAKFGHEPKGGWSLESEMTKGSSKIAKHDGRTPFQLLYDYRFGGDIQAGALFVEFAREFSGKAHIRWSQGLRKLLDLDNFVVPEPIPGSDADPETKPVFQLMCALPWGAWINVILRHYGRRWEFLNACSQGEIEASECLARWGYTGQVYWLENRMTAKPAISVWLENYNREKALTAKPALPQQSKIDFGD